MKVLVTGGAGYIGSHVLVELLENDYEVCVVDNLHNSHQESLERVKALTNRQFPFYAADICDENALDEVFDLFKPQLVMHFAGLKSVKESVDAPLPHYINNVLGSLSLLKMMDKHGCRKIIFSSSATVYGDPEYLPIDENHKLAPKNPYGHSKVMVEQVIKDWSNKQNKARILRYFNPIGAHESGLIGECSSDTPNNLMPLIENVASGSEEFLSIFGSDYDTPDGTGIRDYVHVVDLARSHVETIRSFDRIESVDVFNVGTGQGSSVLEVLSGYREVLGKDVPYRIEKRRKGDVAESVADPRKILEILNWKAEYSVIDAIKSSHNWKLKNPDGFTQTSD